MLNDDTANPVQDLDDEARSLRPGAMLWLQLELDELIHKEMADCRLWANPSLATPR